MVLSLWHNNLITIFFLIIEKRDKRKIEKITVYLKKTSKNYHSGSKKFPS